MTIIIDGTTGISSIGTLTGVTSISSAAANTPVVMQDSGSNTNTCRAWVNFNGTGTVAIRGSFNVSSITDNGTGNYTVNFTTAMPDANYAAVCNTVSTLATNINYALGPLVTGTLPDTALSTYSTTAVQVLGRDSGGTARDATLVTVSIFR